MSVDNAASRLADILTSAKNIGRNKNCIDAWDDLLRANGDRALMLSRMGKVIMLPQEIKSSLESGQGMVAGANQHISNQFFAAYVSQRFSESWSTFYSQIDAHLENYLQLASRLLEADVRTKRLADEDLEEIKDKFLQVLNEVRMSEIDPRLKVYVCRKLNEILDAIDDYFISGAVPILNSVESTAGHTLVDQDFKALLKDTELGARIMDSLTAAANLVTVAVGIPQLAQLTLLIGSNA